MNAAGIQLHTLKFDFRDNLRGKSQMIIPIRCMSCGNTIADKWTWYKNQLKSRRVKEDRYYMDGSQIPKTLELELMNRLGFKRPCCRKHFLTHVDLMEKI